MARYYEFEHEYIMTSERAYRRDDEYENHIYSDRELEVGDTMVMDGLVWFVVRKIK